MQTLSLLADCNEKMLASMASGLFTLDLDGRLETFNTSAETITGWQRSEVCGRPYQHVFAGNAQFLEIIETSRWHRIPLTAPRVDFCHRDGHPVLLALRTTMLQDSAAHAVGVLVVFEDISPRQKLEDQLRRAERLAALGERVAGIAHEMKNPLAAIHTFTQLVNHKRHDDRFVEKFNRIVPRELDRIKHMIEGLLDLAKPAPLHRTPVSISTILQQVIESQTEQMRQRHIALKTSFASTSLVLLADPEQLYRGFINVTLNAMEAMPAGGELTIICRPVPRTLANVVTPDFGPELDEPTDDTSRVPDLYTSALEVTFNDTGEGIPAEQIDDVFMPFHTTKPRGTGLGLALTHKIIEEHHGSIHLASQVGHGTTVTITLPLLMASLRSSAHIS